jgi:hypothetical protein
MSILKVTTPIRKGLGVVANAARIEFVIDGVWESAVFYITLGGNHITLGDNKLTIP